MKLSKPGLKSVVIGAVAGLLVLVAGCGSIGDGNTLKKIEIVSATGAPVSPNFQMYQCLRDQVIAMATFTDGVTTANFSNRVTWTSEDENYVKVSNGDIAQQFVFNNVFNTATASFYSRGVLVPVQNTPTDPADPKHEITITATFGSLSASVPVTVGQPEIAITSGPLVGDFEASLDPSTTLYLGEGTSRLLRLIAKEGNRVVQSTELNALGSINPVLWTFTTAAISDPIQLDADGAKVYDDDFDKFVVGTLANPGLTLSSGGGGLFGYTAGSGGTVQASLGLCPATPAFQPTKAVEVAPIDSLELRHEAGFDGDIVLGTVEQLKIIGKLDTPDGIVEQDLTSQARGAIPASPAECVDAKSACMTNDTFVLQAGFSARVAPPRLKSDGKTERPGGTTTISACFPGGASNGLFIDSYSPLMSLGADAVGGAPMGQISVAAGTPVTLTASHVYPVDGATLQNYTFNFDEDSDGDGKIDITTTTSPTITHTYATAGVFRPTVTATDDCGAISGNVGAALVAVAQTATPPAVTAGTLKFNQRMSTAPTLVAYTASGFTSVGGKNVYEFDLYGDGSAIVRQTSNLLSFTYFKPAGAPPTVKLINSGGNETATASAAVAITNTLALSRLLSAALPFNGVAAKLDPASDFAICPGGSDADLADAAAKVQACTATTPATDSAFSMYPGFKFDAVANFIATDTTKSAFAGGVASKRQKVSRQVTWSATEWDATLDAATTTRSEYVTVSNGSDGFNEPGQVIYLTDPASAVDIGISAATGTALKVLLPADTTMPDIAPAKYTLNPCTAC